MKAQKKANHLVHIKSDISQLNELIVDRFVKLARLSIADHGAFHVALSGGATPQALYRLLVSAPYKTQISWEQIYLYQTDERFVPFDHEENNFQMIQRQMLDNLFLMASQYSTSRGLPAGSIEPFKIRDPADKPWDVGLLRGCFRMDTSLKTAHDAALVYENILSQQLPKNNAGYPQFDFILLGIGTDGHIASLFPETEALSVLDRYVVDVFVPQLDAWRISLTLSALNQARHIAVLITGENKAAVVENLFRNSPEISYPAHQLKTINPIEWYIDSAAASQLTL